MISVVQASDDDRQEWNRFVDSSAEAFAYHSYEWRHVFERAYGHRCFYLVARRDNGETCGLLPLVQLRSRLFGNFLVSVPCFSYAGTLATDAGVRKRLIEAAWSLAQELGASHVEMRHRNNLGEIGLPSREDKVSMQLKLPASSDMLFDDFPSKLRSQIRRPEKAGAVCVDGGVELLDEFYSVFSRNMRDLGTPVFPRILFREICENFPDQTRLFVVSLDGTPCATGMTFGFRDCLEIPFASSLRRFNRFSVNMLLYWNVLKHAVSNGYSVFDFGRSTKGTGTHRFKKQWGAEEQPLRWHYKMRDGQELPKLNPHNPKFRLAAQIWRRLPLALANSIGPRIVRNLP